MKKLILICFALFTGFWGRAQQSFPVNGTWDVRPGQYAFTNANIVVSADQTISNGVLLVKDRLIEAAGQGLTIPRGYVVIDLKGKYIYPGLIDAFTTYGIPDAPRQAFNGRVTITPVTTKPGAYNWNEAIRPEFNARTIFHADAAKAEDLKKNGFGAVQSLIHDGIARGTSVVVSLGDERDNMVMINDRAAAHYSFSKGTAATNYPSALMGSIALLRQTYYDADWYKTQKEEYNISLAEFNQQQNLPQIFEAGDPFNVLRADKIAKEFGKQYIYKTDGSEYRRLEAIKNTGASLIIPLTFPEAYDIEDPVDAKSVSYEQLKSWELAPGNPAALEKAGIRFAITTYGLQSNKDFWTNLRTAIDYGLSEKQALLSLTQIPAELLGVSDKLGTLTKGKLANFIITSDNLFKKDDIIYENWVEGRQYIVSRAELADLRGNYSLTGAGLANTSLKIGGTPGSYELNVIRSGADSVSTRGTISRNGDIVSIYFDLKDKPAGSIRLTGYISLVSPVIISGDAVLPDGTFSNWSANLTSSFTQEAAKPESKPTIEAGPIVYPLAPYGNIELPKQESTLFKNATVWTNEKEGILQNTDVLIANGKIKAIGKNLPVPASAKVVDASGKHISPGIIDEHSHIAASGGINEGTQSVTSEVRIGDVLDSEDINLYRQLAGGVTTSHILHGSANAIGGQTMLIKHRWGVLPDEMKFEGAPGFIKFALGENVKQTNWGIPEGTPNMRFPQSRMGVEQVYVDAFTRAKEYKAARAVKGNHVRRDLELDALVEILDDTRHITCHSYVQSEINMLMHVADSMGFKVNTFTHILEGYKVADKMLARNIAASTFSDWWAYKMEVSEAIPYNGALMHDVGLTTAFNSDDEEMARRLNQEAGKSVAYGKLSEEEALKLVTLNPAKMLHVEQRVGSLKEGKDADIVVWSADPLSIYAVAEKTYVDGVKYWDIDEDAAKQKALKADEARIIQKMIAAKNKGAATQKPSGGKGHPRYTCDTIEDDAYVVADNYNGLQTKNTEVQSRNK